MNLEINSLIHTPIFMAIVFLISLFHHFNYSCIVDALTYAQTLRPIIYCCSILITNICLSVICCVLHCWIESGTKIRERTKVVLRWGPCNSTTQIEVRGLYKPSNLWQKIAKDSEQGVEVTVVSRIDELTSS